MTTPRNYIAPKPVAAKQKTAEPQSTVFNLPQRNVLQEGRDATQVIQEAYPQLYGLQNQWNPQFAGLEARTAGARSAAETGVVQQSGTSIRDAIRGASPEIAASGNALLSQLDGLGPSGIESELTDQALGDLRLGGSLNDEEIRQVVQGGRAADSARGMANGSVSGAMELLNRSAASDARKLQRQQVAGAVDATSRDRIAGDRAFTLSAGQQAMNQYDPYQRIFGSGGSAASGSVGGLGQFGSYLNSTGQVGQSNQQSALATLGMQEDSRQFDINRIDTAKYTAQNREDTNNNAAAARSTSTKNSAITAGVGAAALLALAFL